MDATRLPMAAEARTPEQATTTEIDHPAPIAGRFVMQGSGAPSPTGIVGDATDLQGGGSVTLKLVPTEVLPTPTMADRALRELKQLGKVASDRLVRVVDQGRAPDGRVYVATERTDGWKTLEELVAQSGALSIERAKAIVLQVGEALTEAQKVGVIHRDVAPRNIYVDDEDRVKVGDFGLAEPVPGTNGRVFGAPAFLAPEQAEGKPVDQRSNIYSLGAVYYFALTGSPPFSGDAASLLQQHLATAAPPPSSRRPGLGGDIDRVIGKALEKSGGRRHLTLRQLLTEVAAAQSQPMRADSGARTMMGEAPALPPSADPPRSSPMAATIMDLAPPVVPIPAVAAPPHPVAVAASRPAAVAAGAPTMMAEAPPTRANAPTAVPTIPTQAPTMVNEAPRRAVAAPTPPANANANATGKKGTFRETAWFKRGELEEEIAKRQADAGDNPLKTGTTGEEVALDDSQVALSAQDQARLSLKTGGTQAMPVVKNAQAALPGERMNEYEMLAEISQSKKYFMIAGLIVAAVVAGVVIWLATRAPSAAEPPPAKPAPVAASPPAPAPSPPPPQPAAAPTPSPTKTEAAAPAQADAKHAHKPAHKSGHKKTK